MTYEEFAHRFLAALYLETERDGQRYHKAQGLLEKYGLAPKPHWISRISNAWENRYFDDVSKVLSGYENWSFSISAEGSEKIEADFSDEDELRKFLNAKDSSEIYALSNKLAPASDRVVSLSDNLPLVDQIDVGIGKIQEAISSSNELNPDEKSDVVESLVGAKNLIKRSKTLLVGAFRYLVVERVKKAFEKIIEDALRFVILSVLAILVLAILAAS